MDDTSFPSPNHIYNSGNTLVTRSNTLFSTFSSMGLSCFCLAQYLWGASPYFTPIAILIVASIMIWICCLSFSDRLTSKSSLWSYLSHCSNVCVIPNFGEIFLCAHWLSLKHHADILLLLLFLVTHVYIFFHIFKKHFPSYHPSIINKCSHWCKSNTALVIVIASAVVAAIVWYYCPEESALGDLALNLLAGFISSIITIAVIEKIIQHQKERNEKPLREALYRDTQIFRAC